MFAKAHLAVVLVLWSGLFLFTLLVIAATLQVGELPTYGNPDPKDVNVPGLYALALAGVNAMFYTCPIVFLMVVLRPILAPRARGTLIVTSLSVLGIVLVAVFHYRFLDWFAD